MSAAPGASEVFPPARRRTGWRAADAERTRRVRAVCLRADTVLASASPIGAAQVSSTDLDRRARSCLSLLADGSVDAAVAASAAALLAELCALAEECADSELETDFRRIAECERGLTRLRERSTTADLIDGVCDELIRSLGLRRAMLARVEGGSWQPWKANAAMLEEAWVADWIERSIPLDELTLETRLLSERRPELVLDTNVAGIAQMVRAAGVSSYVVAPIMPDRRVVGFLHADHGTAGRACDEMDRDLLWAFAEGFGHCYEQVLLVEEMQQRREQVRHVVASVGAGLDGILDDEVELTGEPGSGRSPDRPPLAGRASGARLDRLTARELEVLELVVAGARNTEIAERLTISLGTVKSHVTHLLSKLGVVNRSQLIALYLGATDPGRT